MTMNLHAYNGTTRVETISIGITMVGDGAFATLVALDDEDSPVAAFTQEIPQFSVDQVGEYTEQLTAKWSEWIAEHGFTTENIPMGEGE